MCLGKVWGVKQLCLSVFHIADSIGSGRWRHGRNSLEREILSYVYAANGSEGKKEGEEKQLKNDTNRNILGQQATNSTAPRSSNRDNVRKTLLMGIATKVLVGFKRSEGRRLWTISMRLWSKAGINFTPGMAYPYEVINFILSRPRPNISAITISWTAPKNECLSEANSGQKYCTLKNWWCSASGQVIVYPQNLLLTPAPHSILLSVVNFSTRKGNYVGHFSPTLWIIQIILKRNYKQEKTLDQMGHNGKCSRKSLTNLFLFIHSAAEYAHYRKYVVWLPYDRSCHMILHSQWLFVTVPKWVSIFFIGSYGKPFTIMKNVQCSSSYLLYFFEHIQIFDEPKEY